MSLGNRSSQHSFARIPNVNIGRSAFDRSHTVKDTNQFDYLNPIYVDEVLPGDTHSVQVNSFIRLATQIVPILDNIIIDFFFFFIPNRLVWDNWEKFNGAQDNPGDSTDFLVPITTTPAGGWAVGSIGDKFGMPTQVTDMLHQSMPLRAYNLVYNEWFRDQNMQNSLAVPKGDGPDMPTTFNLKKRGKRHDYFTSALPWPQKGPAVTVPLGSSAPVNFISAVTVTGTGTGVPEFGNGGQAIGPMRAQSGTAPPIWNSSPGSTNTNSLNWTNPRLAAGVTDLNASGAFADLTTAAAATINSLRQAFMVQSLYERDAVGGTRYVEILRAHFGVTSPDFRLQRPEYLGGGSTRINTHPVAQTAPESAGSTPAANLTAYATASAGPNDRIGFSKSFVEHGYVIGLMCARGDITYQQGLNKMWTRQTRFDFFWPKLQQLGEQAILRSEIYAANGGVGNNTVFGYQERYAEYRYKPSEIRGQFRSTYATSLDFWHLAQEFGSAPVLGDTFIQQNTPIERALAVPTEPHLLCDYFFKVKSVRPMMAYGSPATLGRF